MKLTDETAIAYLAGILDGEGSLSHSKTGRSDCNTFRDVWQLALKMTDLDVVRDFADYANAPSVRSDKKAEEHHKQPWQC